MKKYFKVLITLLLGTFLSQMGCENNYPGSLWPPPDTYRPNPIINAVYPTEGTFAGIGEVTIVGSNFSSINEENRVYFSGEKGTTLFSSADSIIILAPNVVSDSFLIQVDVTNAIDYAEFFPYKLKSAVIEYGDFNEFDDAYGICFDSDSSLYVSLAVDNQGTTKKIVRITPDGVRHDYATTLVAKASNMKMGPGGYIYYVNVLTAVIRIPPGGGSDELFAIAPGGVFDLDFDQNDNLFCGGGAGSIYRFKPDASVATMATNPDIYIQSLRVFDGYVYIAGEYVGADTLLNEQKVWRYSILDADGNLGSNEIVFDWLANFPNNDIKSITFSQDGDMYVGTDAPEAIIIIHQDGSFEALYSPILDPSSYSMCWGNDQYLYVNRKSDTAELDRIIQIDMLKPGAPYYGRD